MKLKRFSIPFTGLKQGKHEFGYGIDNTFFESFDYQEFNDSKIEIKAVLNKMSTMMELEIVADGSVNVACDVTSEPFDQPIKATLFLVIKFGEAFNDENDEILIIPHGEHQINIAQYIYELSVLAVPQKRIHPGVADGTLRSVALDRLEALEPKERKEPNKETDPRWDDLKKLLNDK